ncbi:RNA-binding transcriptional accessory protein [Oceanispirochaeta crateris]|uniref:RNA-binding transcriptional accessory protein n=1 Tax=Oceanispirochaeta crateris TaxID=2518645 RepID=A0A5C1QLZ7_9SPIO|nr:Tex family protein [Oceanispirochaeta crateris]QEN07584.1 RNA-binding transcriptional accessory protein [Oceanispirochaeta crateris]
MTITKEIARKYSLPEGIINNVLTMAEEGATVPFMARYRKERTGNLDEVQISSILKSAESLKELEKRKIAVLKSIDSQGKLTDVLRQSIERTTEISILEDLYLPFKPRKKTRGMIAQERGLEPLAEMILKNCSPSDIKQEDFYGKEGQVQSWEEALQGASDILADRLNEDLLVRKKLRTVFTVSSILQTKPVKGKEEEGQKYRDYFDREEPSAHAPSHRILAMYRAADEGFLKLKVRPDPEKALKALDEISPVKSTYWTDFVQAVEKDCYKRLLAPSLESENRKRLKEAADNEAIRVFAENLKVLLMESPLGQKATLALDPGLRTGCKIVCLSPQGQLLSDGVIYPLAPHNKTVQAEETISKLVKKYNIEAVAVGNGTGGREAQKFCNSLSCLKSIPVVLVNESGASIYSASEIARKEFPDYDLTVRGAVSIGRRLMDPLAELVKLDPSSIGVGQYQHDVNQKSLSTALDEVVMHCVNSVGIELNTASEKLLSYVSGLTSKTAAAIVAYRDEHGPFKSREEIKKVKGVGQKCFEQASGFLRIKDSKNPLDNTAIHPEQYAFVDSLCSRVNKSLSELIADPKILKSLSLGELTSENRGVETIRDIIKELEQPGRDPREDFKNFEFSEDVHTIDDLKEEMILPGVITNVTAFGAFVDLGVHQDGLIHISQMADHYISNPSEVVKVSQKLMVRILEVDLDRKRISCSIKGINRD